MTNGGRAPADMGVDAPPWPSRPFSRAQDRQRDVARLPGLLLRPLPIYNPRLPWSIFLLCFATAAAAWLRRSPLAQLSRHQPRKPHCHVCLALAHLVVQLL
jgi:hypothetical protein